MTSKNLDCNAGSRLQRENYFSAATLVADVSDPAFDGTITYDAPDDGTPTSGSVSVFAAGLRNPYGIVLHSNGYLYGTDNGSNLGYGDMATGCGVGEFMPDVETEDKINLLVQGGYYGHPNPKRAAVDNDPRQCVWRSPFEPSDADFTAPLLRVPASTDGIIEFVTDHFDGQLRGNLIASKYQDGLLRVILTPDGTSVIQQSDPALPLVGDDGLDVAQAPDGTLVDARVGSNAIYYHKPVEPPTTDMVVKGVFPTRGSQVGNSTLDIYGINFSGTPIVSVGGSNCPVTSVSSTKIECTLPGGTGTVDIVVTLGPETSTFNNGYRYITGVPATPSTGQWIMIDSNATIVKRHEACMVMVGRKAYIAGGRETQDLDIYDPVTRTWSKGAPAPKLLHHMQCVAAQGKLWIMAAWTGYYPREENAEHAYMYDPATNSWTTLPALPIDRRRGSAAVMVSPDETMIYVSHGNSGGHEDNSDNVDAQSLPYLDVYNITSQTWTALSSSAPNPRDHTGGFMKDGKLYIAGGRNGGLDLQPQGGDKWPEVPETDCYDLATEEWSVVASIPNPRSGANYGITCDGNLMIAGGERGTKGIWDEVSIFDGTSWTVIDNLNIGRHGTGLAVDCTCNQIHIASGAGGQGGAPLLNSLETYFPSGVDPGIDACSV